MPHPSDRWRAKGRCPEGLAPSPRTPASKRDRSSRAVGDTDSIAFERTRPGLDCRVDSKRIDPAHDDRPIVDSAWTNGPSCFHSPTAHAFLTLRAPLTAQRVATRPADRAGPPRRASVSTLRTARSHPRGTVLAVLRFERLADAETDRRPRCDGRGSRSLRVRAIVGGVLNGGQYCRASAVTRSTTGCGAPQISKCARRCVERGNLVLMKFAIARLGALVFALLAPTLANAALTVTPITFNVVGLDSNSPASGPKYFPVGARVCTNVATTNVTAAWAWDSANPNINVRAGSLSSLVIPAIAAGACADAYFEIEVNQIAAAFDTTRRYHVTATDGSGSASSPTPREIYVEHLISQSRNAVTGAKLNGVPIPAGGSVALVLGNTYTIELDSGTATQGYNQFESFINFSNAIFQIQSVTTAYSANNSPYVSGPAPAIEQQALCRRLSVGQQPGEPELPLLHRRRFQEWRLDDHDDLCREDHRWRRHGPDPVDAALRFFGQQLPLQRRFFGQQLDRQHCRPDCAHLRQGILASARRGWRYVDAHLHHREPQRGRDWRRQFQRHAAIAGRQPDGRGQSGNVRDIRLWRSDFRSGGGRFLGLLCQRHGRRQQQLYGQRSRRRTGAADQWHLCQRLGQSVRRVGRYRP